LIVGFPRQALHAKELGIVHPVSGIFVLYLLPGPEVIARRHGVVLTWGCMLVMMHSMWQPTGSY